MIKCLKYFGVLNYLNIICWLYVDKKCDLLVTVFSIVIYFVVKI